MIKKIIHKLALTCKEATLLMELKDSNTISSFQKLRLTLHLLICKYCTIYKKKRAFMNQLLQRNEKELNEVDNVTIDRLKVKINMDLKAKN